MGAKFQPFVDALRTILQLFRDQPGDAPVIIFFIHSDFSAKLQQIEIYTN